MKNPLHRYAVGALALGAVAAGGVTFGLRPGAPAWQPVTVGLHASPAALLPATVSAAQPVRVVGTTLDSAGRPVVTVHTATDRAAAADYVRQGQSAAHAVGVELDAVTTADAVPAGSDPYRAQQWDLGRTGTGDAWARSTGAGVTVAVLDTGVDGAHPDLAGQVLPGYDTIAGRAGANTDPNGHGTHVAGTIAAVTGNDIGVSGFAPQARIMPVRVLGANGTGFMSNTAIGIVYAADHGAGVINMSLGSTAPVSAVTNAIAYARSKGVVVVAAVGNSRQSGSPVSYPGADQGVIGVAATDSRDVVATYSNQGAYVDVAAPGSSILSTYPTALGTGGYAVLNGTSMASPHVAALAALIEAYRPGITPDQVERAIETSAVDLGSKGRDNDYGYGRIDANAALTAAATLMPGSSPASPVASRTTTVPSTAPSIARTTAPTTSVPARTTAPTPGPTAPTPTAPAPSGPTMTPSPRPSGSVSTAPRVRPVVTFTPATRTVTTGTTAITTFTVTANDQPWANRPVQICLAPLDGAFNCTTASTGGNGVLMVGVQANAAFQLRMVVPATDISEAVTSGTATVSVR